MFRSKLLKLVLVLIFSQLSFLKLYSQSKPNTVFGLKAYYMAQKIDSCLTFYEDTTGQVLQIVLIRHGEPDVSKKGWRNRKEAKAFIHAYDSVFVLPIEPLPLCVEARGAGKIFYSPLPRAASTAHMLFEDRDDMTSDERFREFERKVVCFPNIKMPLKVWMGLSRGLWVLGLNDKDIESFKAARKRAKENARFLAEVAHAEPLVIVVAHGFHNKYVAKYLEKDHWQMVRDGGNGYAGITIMAKEVGADEQIPVDVR